MKTEQKKDTPHAHVKSFLLKRLPAHYIFHNFEHSEEVLEVAKKLFEAYDLKKKSWEALQYAILFMHTGFTVDPQRVHEESMAVCRSYLEELGQEESQIQLVNQLIQSLKSDSSLETLEEKILHDAYWSFVGRKRFFDRIKLLRLEQEELSGKKFLEKEWQEKALQLILNTKFLTREAQDRYNERKSKNLAKQMELVQEGEQATKRKKSGKDIGRGIDTVFRTTMRNHINLSSIADGKANMIISINTVMLSILITVGSAGFSMSTYTVADKVLILIPVLILMITALVAIIFAVMSAMPTILTRKKNESNSNNKDKSSLFFGNFLQLKKEEFVDYMKYLKMDQEILYDDLARDLYNLGIVLDKKYKLLTTSYRVFVFGLSISFIGFLILFLLNA